MWAQEGRTHCVNENGILGLGADYAAEHFFSGHDSLAVLVSKQCIAHFLDSLFIRAIVKHYAQLCSTERVRKTKVLEIPTPKSQITKQANNLPSLSKSACTFRSDIAGNVTKIKFHIFDISPTDKVAIV